MFSIIWPRKVWYNCICYVISFHFIVNCISKLTEITDTTVTMLARVQIKFKLNKLSQVPCHQTLYISDPTTTKFGILNGVHKHFKQTSMYVSECKLLFLVYYEFLNLFQTSFHMQIVLNYRTYIVYFVF